MQRSNSLQCLHRRSFTVICVCTFSNDQINKVVMRNTALCDWTTEDTWLQQSTERKNYSICWDSRGKSLLPLAQRREKSLWDFVTLSYMCNSENQLSELCLLPWSSDRNTQGESESMSALPPVSMLQANSVHPPPGLLILHLILFISCTFNVSAHAHLSPAAAHCGVEARGLFM